MRQGSEDRNDLITLARYLVGAAVDQRADYRCAGGSEPSAPHLLVEERGLSR